MADRVSTRQRYSDSASGYFSPGALPTINRALASITFRNPIGAVSSMFNGAVAGLGAAGSGKGREENSSAGFLGFYRPLQSGKALTL